MTSETSPSIEQMNNQDEPDNVEVVADEVFTLKRCVGIKKLTLVSMCLDIF